MSKFWGLTVSHGKKFKQVVKEPFCISGAALEPVDPNTGKYDDKPVLLYLQNGDNSHLICSLAPSKSILQTVLNIRIGCGEDVLFHVKGGSANSKVHLTGYTLPKVDALVTPSPGQSKTVQKSILKTEPNSGDKKKKRVSIVETEAYGEREELESDEDSPFGDAAKKLFNGNSGDSEEDEDDDDDEDSDSALSDGELEELQQFGQKGKYNPKTGGKLGDDEDSDDLDIDDDDDEDDDDEDEDEDDDNDSDTPKEVAPKQTQKQSGSQANTPNKDKKMNINLNNLNKKQEGTPKTLENKQLKKVTTPSSAGQTPMKSYSKGGVLVSDLRVGNGQVAKSSKMVTVYYEGRLKANNKRFDATLNGPGFKFRLGKGEVIRGWDLGVEGMKVGGKRKLIIPAQLAYGKRGAPPDIPSNSTLVFDVELKNVS